MSDHSRGSKPGRAIRKIVGVRELKAHAARILREVRDAKASYILTHRGRAVGVILPLDAENFAAAPDDSDDSDAWPGGG